MKIPNRDRLTTEDRAFLQNAFMHYMEGGGFPEVLSLSAQPKVMKQYVKELYEKIISRDIIQRRKIKNVKALKEIAFLLTAQFAQQFTYQSVKKISTVKSVNTVKNYIEYLQESYLGFILEPYSHKIKERISLPKKYYIADISIANAFCSDVGSDFGRKLENIVYIELRRQGHELYYAKKPQYEIDFLIRKGRAIIELIQVSWSIQDEQTRGRELKALIRGAKDLKCRDLKIITYSEEESLVYEGYSVQVIPVWKWLLATPT